MQGAAAWDTNIPYWRTWDWVPPLFLIQIPANAPKRQQMVPNYVVFCYPHEWPRWSSSSLIQSGPALAVAGIWGMNQQMDALSISATLTFKYKSIKHNKKQNSSLHNNMFVSWHSQLLEIKPVFVLFWNISIGNFLQTLKLTEKYCTYPGQINIIYEKWFSNTLNEEEPHYLRYFVFAEVGIGFGCCHHFPRCGAGKVGKSSYPPPQLQSSQLRQLPFRLSNEGREERTTFGPESKINITHLLPVL